MSTDTLAGLERLQQLDLESAQSLTALAELPTRRKTLIEAHATAQKAADQMRGRLADNERDQRATRQRLEEEREKVKKWESRLPQLKHPREFAALQREIEGAKKNNLQADEDLKRLDAEGAELKAQLRVREAEQASKEAELTSETAALDAEESRLTAAAAEFDGRRAELRAKVDPAMLKLYDTARRRAKGKLVVPMVRDNCTGCMRKLPASLANALFGGAIDVCPSCARILYNP
jgi:predicted  nucleic acid-binding Zn-ribbon protein